MPAVVLAVIGFQTIVLVGGGLLGYLKALQLRDDAIAKLQIEVREALDNMQTDFDDRQQALIAFLEGVAKSAKDNLQ